MCSHGEHRPLSVGFRTKSWQDLGINLGLNWVDCFFEAAAWSTDLLEWIELLWTVVFLFSSKNLKCELAKIVSHTKNVLMIHNILTFSFIECKGWWIIYVFFNLLTSHGPQNYKRKGQRGNIRGSWYHTNMTKTCVSGGNLAQCLHHFICGWFLSILLCCLLLFSQPHVICDSREEVCRMRFI